jgi:hypothetical protein
MGRDEEAEQILTLQQQLLLRLSELGYAEPNSAVRIARHLAEISVLAHAFAEHTVPLLLNVNVENRSAINQIAVSLKVDLEELGDAITDVDADLRSLMEFLNRDHE